MSKMNMYLEAIKDDNFWKHKKSIFAEAADDKKQLYVLVGPPSVGKSTWIKNKFASIKPYIINRDDIVESVAKSYGWTYDDLFITPSEGQKLGDKDEKYGEVVNSPSFMTWAPLSFSKVLEANDKVQNLFKQKVAAAKGQQNIVVDMTNMNAASRKDALKSIEGSESDYHKVAVVFKFEGAEDLIKKVAAKRAAEIKSAGGSKTIPDAAFDRMFKAFQKISSDEGFDEVQNADTIKDITSYLNKK